jgi:hypothetical protein
MSRTSYLVTAVAAISLVACKPSPRYTLHEGTDPLTGRPATLKVNIESGETKILKSLNTLKTNNIYSWEDVYESDAAHRIQLHWFRAVQKDPSLTNDELTIK